MENLKNLKIEGFEFDDNISYKDDSISYNKIGDEDCWIEIAPAYNRNDFAVINYVNHCERVRTVILVIADYNFEKGILEYMPEEMK